MIKIKALLNLSKDIILLVHQLSVFSKIDHWFAQVIISQSDKILQFVSEHYVNFFVAWYSLSDKSMTCRERSVRLNSADSQVSWFLDNRKSKIRKIQADFLTVIIHILEHSSYLNWKRAQFSLSIWISSSSFFIIDSMSDKSLSNDLNVRIEAVIQHVLSN